MKYHFTHNIIHPDKTIADKVNYFADRFQFTLINLCRPGFDEFENHKSLLEKIRTQTTTNDLGLSKKYIKHYLGHDLLKTKNFIVKEFYKDGFKELRKLGQEALKTSNEQSRAYQGFFEKIEELICELDQSLFENCLNSVIDAFHCKFPLNRHDHIRIIDNCVPVLVTELKFSGLPDMELDRLFHVLFSKEVKLSGKRVRTEAPLPPELLNLKRNPNSNPDEVHAAIRSYLNDMGLRNQFWGLYHIYRNSDLKRTFLFKIKHVKSSAEIDLSYGGVRFSNQFKNEYVTEDVSRDRYIEYFEKDVVMAETQVTTSTVENGKQKAILKIQEGLYYFNSFFKQDARVVTDDYIVRDLDQNHLFTAFPKTLDIREIENFDDASLFKFFGSRRNKLIEKVIELDRIFFHATCNPIAEERVALYWTYLEAFFKPNEKPKKIRETVAQFAGKESLFDMQMDQFKIVFKILYNQREESTTDDIQEGEEPNRISRSEMNRYLRSEGLEDYPFKEIESRLKHPYLSQHLKWFNEATHEEKIKRAGDHFTRILFETYEQRNFIVHSGLQNEKAVQKILIVLPDIVSSFRRRVIRVLKEKDFRTLYEAMEL